MKLRYPLLGAAAALSCGMLLAPAASAFPLSAGAESVGKVRAGDAVTEVRYRGRGGPAAVYRGGGARHVYRGGGYRRGPSGAAIGAGVALGVLGAAAAASAASPYYGGYGYGAPAYGGCYMARQPVHDAWGNYLGTRRVQVCE